MNVMKKLLNLSFAIALMGVVATGTIACDGKDEPKDGLLSLSTESLEFIAAGETKTVDVTGKNWKATPSDTWIEVTQTEGKITVVVGENETTDPRTGSITVENADDAKTISVTQEAGEPPVVVDPTLTLDPLKVDFLVEGGTATVTVTSELEWEAGANADWIEVVRTETGFTITVAACPLATGRGGAVTVQNGNETEMKYVAVQQAGTGASISEFTEDVEMGTLLLRGLSYSPNGNVAGADVYLAVPMTDGLTPGYRGQGYAGTGYAFTLQFNATAESGGIIPDGTYQIARNDDPWHVLGGFTPNGQVLIGMWARRVENGVEVQKGPVVYGTVEVTRADGVYTIEVDGLDDKGNAVTATLTGTGEY